MKNKVVYEVARDLFLEELQNEENLFDSNYADFTAWLADHGLEVDDGE